MAVQLRDPLPAPLPLLYEPDRPSRRATVGWRRTAADTYERRYDDDAFGAQRQHAIARYILLGIDRHTLAREIGASPDTMQSYLRGMSWRPYTQPVLRALTRLGLGHTKGRRSHGGRQGRYQEIQTASARLMAQAADVIGGPPLSVLGHAELVLELRRRADLVRDLRFLAIGSAS